MTKAVMKSRIAMMIIAHAPAAAEPPCGTMVTNRLRAVTRVAASVVMYMNKVGQSANEGFFFCSLNQTVTINRLSAAINWLAAPNNCHRYPGTGQHQQNRQEHRNDGRDMHVLQYRDDVTGPLRECDAHHAEDQLGHGQHDDHEGAKAESRTE